MAREWESRDYAVLMTTGTVCLCLLVVVCGTVVAVLNNTLPVEVLGKVTNAGTATGLLGFLFILYQILKVALSKGRSK